MTWKSFIFLISLSACASTVWKNDQEVPPVQYADQFVSYDALNDEVLVTLKKYISDKLKELIDHSNNASNEAYASSLRYYSKEKVRTILNVTDNQQKTQQVDAIINRVKRSSFEQFLIQSPALDKDSMLYSNISLEGKDFIKARIQPKLKLITPDTVKVWEVDFMYLGLEEY